MGQVVVLAGATATGKSAIALAAARPAGAEIVNADALQLYRELDIGTAKPTSVERAGVPHHLIDVLEPGVRSSAGQFARLASAALEVIAARGRPALVVGGSGLYLRALFDGLAPVPAIPVAVRRTLEQRLAGAGQSALRAELEQLDPVAAARIGVNDAHRTLRALEVVLSTGRTLGQWQEGQPEDPGVGAPVASARFGLTLPRAVLYDRITERVRTMIEHGWLEEVRRLVANGVARDAPALQAIGYADWIRHLDGELGFDETVDRIVRATRRYAKRQETWFRHQPGIVWLDARDPERAADEIGRALRGEVEAV